jgi:hypothetical protein
MSTKGKKEPGKKVVKLIKIDFCQDAGGGHTTVFTQSDPCKSFEYGKDEQVVLKCHGEIVAVYNMQDVVLVSDLSAFNKENFKYKDEMGKLEIEHREKMHAYEKKLDGERLI